MIDFIVMIHYNIELCYGIKLLGGVIDETYLATKHKRAKTHGFRARMATPGGRNVLARRRKKGRKVLCA